jgi:serine/threonine protein kinase
VDHLPTVSRVLGRYALYDPIAAGGMASVHLGRLRASAGFTRTVAIKCLHAQFVQDPEFAAMFLDEARMVARISHPNVVPTLDVVSADGELFLVMEYVHGESLAYLSRAATQAGQAIRPEIAVTLMIGVLHGLHAAHEACSERGEPLGIVHRDVSPQNILVGTDGAPRLIDFGVAKAAGRTQTTREGKLKGKLSYMAPEQIRGQVSRLTDVYAASIVLWEMLTGRRLFPGDNEGQIFDRALKGCRTPPSKHAANVSGALDAATLRGLSIDPKRRFASAREMALALEDVGSHVPASKIGAWVDSMATERLRERRERITAIESESLVEERRQGGTSPPITDDQVPTQLSTASGSASGLQAPRGSRGLRRTVAGLATIAAGGALLAVWSQRSVTASATMPPATLPPTESSAPSALAALPDPTARAAASSSSSPPASTHPAATSNRAATSTSPGASPGKSRCSPPWTVDDRGVRSFKKECF